MRNEIAVGYKKLTEDGIRIIINPGKLEKISFQDEDYLIVIAEDNN
jgi:hypothetical protein